MSLPLPRSPDPPTRRPHLRHTSLRTLGHETNVANSARVLLGTSFGQTSSPGIHYPKLCKWHEGFMTDAQLLERVRQLRGEGRSPKEISRALELPPAMISPVIRQIAREISTEATALSVLGCWISPGWHIGLGVEEFGDWPIPNDCGPGHAGWDLSPTRISGLLLVISNHFRGRAQSGSARTESRSMSRDLMTMPLGTYERLSARSARTTSRSRCLCLSRCSTLRDGQAHMGNVTCCGSDVNDLEHCRFF